MGYKGPSNIAFFVCCAMYERYILLIIRLEGKNILIGVAYLSLMDESLSHLIYYEVVWYFWSLILMFGVKWMFTQRVGELLCSWTGQRSLSERRKKTWCLVPVELMWLVREERNRRTFEGREELF